MLFIIGWIIYGAIVGSLAKWLHPGEDKMGFLPTIGIGVAGSYIGGLVNFAISGGSGSLISSSGIIMGTIGGIIACFLYRKYRINKFVSIQGRMPGNIVHKKD